MAKDHQPALRSDIAAGFAFAAAAQATSAAFPPEPLPAPPSATTVDKGHGRVEQRMTTLLTVGERWRRALN